MLCRPPPVCFLPLAQFALQPLHGRPSILLLSCRACLDCHICHGSCKPVLCTVRCRLATQPRPCAALLFVPQSTRARGMWTCGMPLLRRSCGKRCTFAAAWDAKLACRCGGVGASGITAGAVQRPWLCALLTALPCCGGCYGFCGCLQHVWAGTMDSGRCRRLWEHLRSRLASSRHLPQLAWPCTHPAAAALLSASNRQSKQLCCLSRLQLQTCNL